MFCPPSLLEVEEEKEKDLPANLQLNNGEQSIQFMNKFKYLGSWITPCLMENMEIEAQIKKAKSQLGMLKHFFSCKDVEIWLF